MNPSSGVQPCLDPREMCYGQAQATRSTIDVPFSHRPSMGAWNGMLQICNLLMAAGVPRLLKYLRGPPRNQAALSRTALRPSPSLSSGLCLDNQKPHPETLLAWTWPFLRIPRMNQPSSANLGMTPETGIVISPAMVAMSENILLCRQGLLASCLFLRCGRPIPHAGKADLKKQDSGCMGEGQSGVARRRVGTAKGLSPSPLRRMKPETMFSVIS